MGRHLYAHHWPSQQFAPGQFDHPFERQYHSILHWRPRFHCKPCFPPPKGFCESCKALCLGDRFHLSTSCYRPKSDMHMWAANKVWQFSLLFPYLDFTSKDKNISRHLVTHSDQDDIAHHKLRGVNLDHLAITKHSGSAGKHIHKLLQHVAWLVLLIELDEGIQKSHANVDGTKIGLIMSTR